MARHRNTKLPTGCRSAILRSCALALASSACCPAYRRSPARRARRSRRSRPRLHSRTTAPSTRPSWRRPRTPTRTSWPRPRSTDARRTSSPIVGKVKECCGYPIAEQGGLPPLLLLDRVRVGVRQRIVRHRRSTRAPVTTSAASRRRSCSSSSSRARASCATAASSTTTASATTAWAPASRRSALARASARRRRAEPTARALPLHRRRSALHPHRRHRLRAGAGRRASARRHAPRRLPARRRHGRRDQGAQARLLRRELQQLQVHRRQPVVAHEGDAARSTSRAAITCACTTPRERDNDHTDFIAIHAKFKQRRMAEKVALRKTARNRAIAKAWLAHHSGAAATRRSLARNERRRPGVGAWRRLGPRCACVRPRRRRQVPGQDASCTVAALGDAVARALEQAGHAAVRARLERGRLALDDCIGRRAVHVRPAGLVDRAAAHQGVRARGALTAEASSSRPRPASWAAARSATCSRRCSCTPGSSGSRSSSCAARRSRAAASGADAALVRAGGVEAAAAAT